ncbi:hypothetical protein M5689_006772 [Euphorbia peplus]|nr:hypothetical protein M5689_006772 [Euphorbia peplus]
MRDGNVSEPVTFKTESNHEMRTSAGKKRITCMSLITSHPIVEDCVTFIEPEIRKILDQYQSTMQDPLQQFQIEIEFLKIERTPSMESVTQDIMIGVHMLVCPNSQILVHI